MKIAVVTNDGKTISQHFGRAPYYSIISVENNEEKSREIRQRQTGHFGPHHHHHEHHHENGGGHGYGPDARKSHFAMAQEIDDFQVLIAGGMGRGAYENFKEAGLEVVMTDLKSIDEAVEAYVTGTIKNLVNERTH